MPRNPKAIASALRIAKRYADGGYLDPKPMGPSQRFSTKEKSPRQRVIEGHQEFEPGYARGWDWGGGASIMNMRGQTLETRRTADGGAIEEQRTAPFPEKPEGYQFFGPSDNPEEGKPLQPQPIEQPAPVQSLPGAPGAEGMLSYDPAQAPAPPSKPVMMEPDLQTLQTGQQDLPEGYAINDAGEVFNKQTGEVLPVTPRPNVLPLTRTPEGQPEFAMPKMLDIAGNMGAGWSVPRGVGQTVLGAGLAVPKKAPKLPGILDLHPEDVKLWQHEFNSQMGTNPGGVYHAPDGKKWYIKTPQTEDHARNEKLAAELYKLAGVPVADVHLTALSGKHAVASPMIEGKTLNKHNPWDYEKIEHLQDSFPADAWLANYDSVGTGKDNVIVSGGKAYRIDMGGALRYRAQGKPKTDFGPTVGEFESMTIPGYKGLSNYDAAEVFGGMSAEAQVRAKKTAQNIASISDQQISNLVLKYGPADPAERIKLFKNLTTRRDQVAQHYGVKSGEAPAASNVIPMTPKEAPKLPNMGASPTAIAKALMVSYGHHVEPAHDIAEALWKIAEKHGYKGADKVVKELPHELWPDIDNNLTAKAHHAGYNPWPEFRETTPMAKALPQTVEPPKTIPKLMQINATHELPQILHSVKNSDFSKLDPKQITDKQKAKIFMMLDKQTPSILAHAMFDAQLTNKQAENIFSWLKDKQKVEAVDHIYDNLVGGGADPGDFFEKTMIKGLKANQPGWLKGFKENYEKIYSKLTDFYQLPKKSLQKREADRIAGGYTTPAFAGYRFEHGLQDPFYEGSLFHSNMLDVAHAYATYKNAAANPKWWDLNHPGILSEYEHAAVQPLWLNTKDYVRVDAKGETWNVGNDMAWDARKKYYHEHGVEPKGAIIENVHDMPHSGGGGDYSHPSGEPFTVYQSWDAGTRRSKWARFDPKNWLKTGLHLGIAGTMVGGMGLVGSEGNGILIQPSRKEGPRMAQGGRMPLSPGSSKKTISKNISEFHTGKTYAHTKAKFGKAKADKQAIAVALSTARKYARGGDTMANLALKGSTIKLSREGMLNSSIPGRTDKLPMKVKAGSYVLPADIPSALGQGNTMAGGEILKKMFSSGAYGLAPMRGGRGSIRPRLKADGGEAEGGEEEGDDHVPIIAAGGEYILPPEVVQDIGHGNMKAGHDVLDKFVLKVRKHHIETLKKLPGPKK